MPIIISDHDRPTLLGSSELFSSDARPPSQPERTARRGRRALTAGVAGSGKKWPTMKAESFGPDPEADGLPSPAAQAPADATGSPRSRRLMSAGWIVSAIGAAGTGALILALVSNVDALTLVGTGGFAMVAQVGAGLIQRGRSARRGAPVVVPASESDMTPLGRRVRYPVEFVVGELLPPPPSSSVAHSASFGTPLPPPPPGVRPQASPLQVRIPDDAAGPVAAEPVAVDEPVVDEPVVDEPVVVDAPILVPLVPEPLAAVGRAPAESPLVPDQERAMASLSTVLHDTGNNVLDQYRQWVLEQALGDTAFHRVDIDANNRDLFMLSSCGVATLLAWLHEQHR
ncbi:MAG: hypothetical protein QOD72_2974, partial [Acidimicrobiaceae bacterium]|nr:hypothetical protein [Acidimicrobiaceae bacterium]